jgi:hypothetical protein
MPTTQVVPHVHSKATASSPVSVRGNSVDALIEGINAKIRLINARGYGHHSAQTLSSMIYLCLGGLHPQLPTRT